jgi:hypothetical protein
VRYEARLKKTIDDLKVTNESHRSDARAEDEIFVNDLNMQIVHDHSDF